VDIKLSLIVSFAQRPKYWEEYQIFGAYSGNTGGRINVTTQPAKYLLTHPCVGRVEVACLTRFRIYEAYFRFGFGYMWRFYWANTAADRIAKVKESVPDHSRMRLRASGWLHNVR
jgi:hypothetical protein